METIHRLFDEHRLGFFAVILIGALCVLALPTGYLFGSNDTTLALRNPDFPRTYIKSINLDLTSPNHWVQLTWTGPEAANQDAGPFQSSPGAGFGTNDCNSVTESNCEGSQCTPKGTRLVEGFSDNLPTHRELRYVTWFDRSRRIGFHAHWDVRPYPSSKGCVRLPSYPAQLIHNNSIAGDTQVVVAGRWTPPPSVPK